MPAEAAPSSRGDRSGSGFVDVSIAALLSPALVSSRLFDPYPTAACPRSRQRLAFDKPRLPVVRRQFMAHPAMKAASSFFNNNRHVRSLKNLRNRMVDGYFRSLARDRGRQLAGRLKPEPGQG